MQAVLCYFVYLHKHECKIAQKLCYDARVTIITFTLINEVCDVETYKQGRTAVFFNLLYHITSIQ